MSWAGAAASYAGRFLPRRDDYAELGTSWRPDVAAGLTVGIVALPLALAFGVSSGVGAAAGLVTAVVAGIVAAVFGGSHVQVSGPTGAMAVILAPIVAVHGASSVALLSLMAGLVVLALGLSRLGRAVAFIPWPVVEGFTLGIGAIIFLQQVPLATGTQVEAGQNMAVAAWHAVAGAQWPEAGLGLALVVGVAAVMLLLPRLHPALPASLIAVVLATLVAEAAALPVARIGALPDSLPAPGLPAVTSQLLSELAGPALAIAALAAIESLLSARVAAGLAGPSGATTGPYDPDRELAGQGLASIASGLFGGMPATGAIARTAVNVRSGARTRASAIVHALLLVVVYAAAPLVSRIPLAALAGILMVTATRMVSRHTAASILRSSRADAALFVVTAFITVAFDLIEAIQIGVLVAAFFALRSVARLSGVAREEIGGEPVPGDERIAVFRLEGSMFFGAAERILQEISSVRGVEVVVLRLSHLRMLDATGAHTLAEIIGILERRGITVLIKGIKPEHVRLADTVGVVRALRHYKHRFDELPPAIEHARSHVRRNAEAREGGDA
ncbi:SulP family inorganic anion transporter [Zafaria sp. J156]|uniref:SulP family inorganic anion transporter n=1 Tax=Zafaria sp. J156 TaxID=3116490 RepID=UPI002E78E7AF|nr:SulP family inorganic anion transporter [Zafaria sp. J156]MEE1620616.1 SulP family inorganic anion transporter [Zafaria sp. J156]